MVPTIKAIPLKKTFYSSIMVPTIRATKLKNKFVLTGHGAKD
jgi:hypothetical protein